MAQNYEYENADVLHSLHHLQVQIQSLQMGIIISSYEFHIDSDEPILFVSGV